MEVAVNEVPAVVDGDITAVSVTDFSTQAQIL